MKQSLAVMLVCLVRGWPRMMINRMKRFAKNTSCTFATLLVIPLISLQAGDEEKPASKTNPNIVYILFDDLGIGDVSCFNPLRNQINTPNIDKLAKGGMMFTDAHSAASVCTPTRYGIMTGRYPWRNRQAAWVLGGTSKRVIEEGRLTVPMLLKQNGYTTGCVGKWHLGMDFIDYGKPITNGPTTVGFDYYFGISASLDMAPFVFIENDRVTEIPSVEKAFAVGPINKGPAAPSFEAIDVLPTLERKAVEFIGKNSKTAKPFFLYLAFASPHTPVVPLDDLRGKSKVGWYGDFVIQTDRSLGAVLAAIDRAGITDNTLVFFASDNGFAPWVGYITDKDFVSNGKGYEQLEARGHFPSAGYRGYKGALTEGGHRIPFIVSWPGKIKAGSTYSWTISLNDLLATCADITRSKLPENAGEDSYSILPALLGKTKGPIRESIVNSCNGDNGLAVSQGEWKLIFSRKGSKKMELYNLTDDPAEKFNMVDKNPEIVNRLKVRMEQIVTRGRSTPGTPQPITDPQQWSKLWWMEGYVEQPASR